MFHTEINFTTNHTNRVPSVRHELVARKPFLTFKFREITKDLEGFPANIKRGTAQTSFVNAQRARLRFGVRVRGVSVVRG